MASNLYGQSQEQYEVEFRSRIIATRDIERIFVFLKGLGINMRNSTKDVNVFTNMNPNTFEFDAHVKASVDLHFNPDLLTTQVNKIVEDVKLLEKAKRIEALRLESPEFDEMVKLVEFTLELSAE